MNEPVTEALLEGVIEIARQAGQAILTVYEQDEIDVTRKLDGTQLTPADLAANRVIIEGLMGLAPTVPVLSEESEELPFTERQKWGRYFLVDPLDGTKEFIKRNGEFTVNIALIDQGVPVLGVVYVPVQDVMYAGLQRMNSAGIAFVERSGSRQAIQTRALQARLAAGEDLVVVASHRRGSPALEDCMARLAQDFPAITPRKMGSSLKLCLIAEGEADLYPCLAPTSEWDTAAAHAVVMAAGGEVVDVAFKPLRYNTKAELLNPSFYVLGDRTFDWPGRLARSDS
jgi:3'(2'), 5'-bisphosphate nucleotidase